MNDPFYEFDSQETPAQKKAKEREVALRPLDLEADIPEGFYADQVSSVTSVYACVDVFHICHYICHD